MLKDARIYVAGHRGLVGSALCRNLRCNGYSNLLTATRQECDLLDAAAVSRFFEQNRPEYVFLAAARVGGIGANAALKADFLRENLLIQTHVLHAAYETGVRKLLFLGSSCIYPRETKQPILEESLLQGALEPTNDAYAVAKIAGILGCKAYREQYGCNFIACMPTNLYGPNDNFDLETSHVLPALLHRFHWARIHNLSSVTLWGSGKPRREFMHVDDMAAGCLHLMLRHDSSQIINLGTGEDLSIATLASMVADVVGYRGEVLWDPTRPDGCMLKRLDVHRLQAMGFRAQIPLVEGLRRTYDWFLKHYEPAEKQMVRR